MTEPLSEEELDSLRRRTTKLDFGWEELDRLLSIAEDHARLVAEVCIRHRCTAHYDVPVQNLNECSGSECGGCIAAQRDTARAENATLLKEREYRFADIAALRAENAKLRERVGKLETVKRAARRAWGMAAFPDVNYGLSDALAALDEEDGT